MGKFILAGVTSVAILLASMWFAEAAYTPGAMPDKAAMAVAAKAQAVRKQMAASGEVDFTALLNIADVKNGAKQFKKCAACHTADDGGSNKIGPNLYNIIGSDKARNSKFSYSKAMKNKGGKWSYDDITAFLTKPSKFIKGTKMAFAGFKNPQDVADIVAYLRKQSDNPVALPSK